MNLFRSEEHAPRGGETVPVATLWQLADAWYRDRLAPGWRPRTREANAAILARLGLTTPLWALE
ncbi:MAG: hypothetical protein WD689_08835 [Gaiellaceae bacterium]